MGKTFDNQPIFVDYHKKDRTRNSHSSIIFGMNGGGKTSFVSKLIINQSANLNTKIFIIDPKKDYYHLVKNLGGIYVDTSGLEKNSITFNPFQIFNNHCDFDVLKEHFRFLKDFFDILFPNINPSQNSLIESTIEKLYEYKNINFKFDLKLIKNKRIKYEIYYKTKIFYSKK
ncbi:MAG: ATP-binding protein [Mycoplasmoidaceae bacterium]